MSRQLIEDAANAAGIELTWTSTDTTHWLPWFQDKLWNPLCDLGQAAELALSLNMSVQHFQPNGIHRVMASVSYVSAAELHGQDKLAATCLAIVTCAAGCKQFIGK